MSNETTTTRDLIDYDTNDVIRKATLEECIESDSVAKYDGGRGVIHIDGQVCYVTESTDETKLESFIAGVMKAHEDNELDTEYASLFRGNVTGSEFENEESAYVNGIEAVENTIERD